MKILLLTRSLDYGGAERQVVEIAKGLSRKGHDVKVLEFYSGGAFEKDLQSPQILLHSLSKRGRWDVVPFLYKMLRYVKHEKPQIIYAFLGIPCILSVFLKLLFPDIKIVWAVLASYVDLSKYDWLFRYAYKVECLLSRYADLVISNSAAGKHYAIKQGFPKNIEVIPSGIDITRFRPDFSARQSIRKIWNVNNSEILVGLIGRLDPIKDHYTFLAAASLVASKFPNLKFVCVGRGAPDYMSKLQAETRKLSLDQRIIWAGSPDDVLAIYNSLDLLVSSSYGEGFSNSIAEAMACGIPCVVTDVGDSPLIVGETGIVVQPKDPKVLADGIVTMLNRTQFLDGTLKNACRLRIVENFSTECLIEETTAVFNRLLCPE